MSQPIRSTPERIADTKIRLALEVDAWVATADPESGAPCLIPLSYLWDDETFLLATPASSVSSRNMQTTGGVRLAVGTTRDVILIEGTVEAFDAAELPEAVADAYASRTKWDPREDKDKCLYFRVRPVRIRAYRDAIELAGRTIMRNGNWLI